MDSTQNTENQTQQTHQNESSLQPDSPLQTQAESSPLSQQIQQPDTPQPTQNELSQQPEKQETNQQAQPEPTQQSCQQPDTTPSIGATAAVPLPPLKLKGPQGNVALDSSSPKRVCYTWNVHMDPKYGMIEYFICRPV